MTSCLASSSNMGSSKNLLMETSSLRPCRREGKTGEREKGDGEDRRKATINKGIVICNTTTVPLSE